MPLIDQIGVTPYSTKKQFVTVENAADGYFVADVINQFSTTLQACGWNLVSSIPPSATISYPTGYVGFTGTGSGSVGCSAYVLTIETLTDIYYFCSYAPGQTPVPRGCIMFELGSDGYHSLESLCAAVNSVTNSAGQQLFNASVAMAGPITLVVTVQAVLYGPDFNYVIVLGDGRFGVSSGQMLGGGYAFQSVGSSVYTVEITGSVGTGNQQVIVFQVTAAPSTVAATTVQYTIPGTNGSYQIIANPYCFSIFDVNTTESLGVFSPCIPSAEGFDSAYCVVVAPPSQQFNEILWDGFFIPAAAALDAPITAWGANTSGPGTLALRSNPGGLPLYSLSTQPLSTAAYLFTAASVFGEPYVIGKFWDCIVIHAAMTVGSTYVNGSRNYVVIASQDGSGAKTQASLLFCFDDNGQPTAGQGGSGGTTGTGGSGTGGGTSPVNPTGPPASGNGSFTGTCTSNGGTNVVEWVSGNQFTSAMVGQTITITLAYTYHGWVSAGGGGDADGTKPVIASIVNSTTLTTTENLNSAFDSAPYTVP
jgi:hypothetical protein